MRQTNLVISAALGLLTLCVFWQVHSFGFIKFDDPSYVTANPHVLQGLTWASVKWAFTGVHGDNWHPLTSLTHLLDVQLFGLHGGLHHLVNLALHITNVLLLFVVLRRMTGAMWCSALVAALFAIHPLRVESVVWISERKDVLSGFFWMLSLLAYWHYARRPSIGRYLVILVFFALGLMSKPMIVTLPVVLLLLDFWPLHRLALPQAGTPATFVSAGGEELKRISAARVIAEKLPMLALSVASGVMTLHAQREAVMPMNSLPIQIRFFNSILSYITYLKKTAWPVDLALFYPLQRQFSLNEIISALFLLAALIVAAILVARRLPYAFVGLFWYLITLLPVIGLIQVGAQWYADRYTYLPAIGIYIIAAWLLKDTVSRYPALRAPLVAVIILVMATLSTLAAGYASLWQSDDSLLQRALQVTRNNGSVHWTLGMISIDQERYPEALNEFDQALKIAPDYPDAYVGRGLAYLGLGQSAEAVKCFRHAIELAPQKENTYIALGTALEQAGQWEESLKSFEDAVRHGADSPFTHSNLAIAYAKRGNIDGAMAQYREALQAYPEHLDSLKGLAWLLATDSESRRRNAAEALKLATKACRLTRFQDPNALQVLAAAQAEGGDFGTASATAQRGLDLVRKQGSKRDKALEQKLSVALELYRSGFAYRR